MALRAVFFVVVALRAVFFDIGFEIALFVAVLRAFVAPLLVVAPTRDSVVSFAVGGADSGPHSTLIMWPTVSVVSCTNLSLSNT